MNSRRPALDLTGRQADLLLHVRQFGEVAPENLDAIFGAEESFHHVQRQLLSDGEEPWVTLMAPVFSVLTSGFFLAKWMRAQLAGEQDSDRFLTAAKAHAGQAQLKLAELKSTLPSLQSVESIANDVAAATSIPEGQKLLKAISTISFPLKFYKVDRPFPLDGRSIAIETASQERPPILSVLFYLQQQPWANPQMLKPGYQYKIRGELKMNFWPEGYEWLNLYPATTTDNRWFTLSLPPIPPVSDGLSKIEGAIVFHHAQASYDEAWGIKLWAELSGPNKTPLSPTIVGYDQLKVKVLTEDSFPLLVRYPNLHQKIFGIMNEIDGVMPNLMKQEREDFVLLLSAILNYQGYCAEFGEYRDIDNLTEDNFRDELIKALSMNPQLPGTIAKERHLAGGRVEITYNNIAAELKVEKSVSDREKVMEAHFKQAAAYATGAAKRLSILCVLDLTAKKNPPATTANNIFLREPPYHGFDTTTPADPSRVVVVFIDGNLTRPSALK